MALIDVLDSIRTFGAYNASIPAAFASEFNGKSIELQTEAKFSP